jgi:signal transduction histidine kinase
MKRIVGSLGVKLICSAVVSLLLCLLFFAATSRSLLIYLSDNEAKSEAVTHLMLIKQAYLNRSDWLLEKVTEAAKNNNLITRVSQHSTPTNSNRLGTILGPMLVQYRLLELAVISMNRHLLFHIGNEKDIGDTGDSIAAHMFPVVDRGLHGETASALYLAQTFTNYHWSLSLAVPIHDQSGNQIGVLMALQAIDDYFAHDLTQTSGLNIVLCLSTSVLGTTVSDLQAGQHIAGQILCNSDVSHTIAITSRYITIAGTAKTRDQLTNTPSLTLVDVEPLYSSNLYTAKAWLLLVALAVFVLSLGVTTSTLAARFFFLDPLRQLQAHAAAVVSDTANEPGPSPLPKGPSSQHHIPVPLHFGADELSTIARSFNLLYELLQMQEDESHAMTEQMRALLTMSETLISTVNLEHLLGEIVSRLANMMEVKHVALLLYGREMLSPWAVAHWTEPSPDTSRSHGDSFHRRGTVTVHTDPAGEVTLVMTTKLAAVSGKRSNSPSGKRTIIRPPQLALPTAPYGLRLPRIPRPALRDLDMTLARIAMQKEKIVCADDVTVINQKQRGEAWAQMAREAGYRSVIAVPLLLQDQAIGAFILYRDSPYQMTSSDTFPLSTMANQAAMAIENALLFAEVKEKNAALERVNNLKSQFLATVTHELRTPLHSIISYGALILEGFVEGELSSEQEEHIQFMVRRAEDLSHLVDDMLDLSKIEADRLEVKIEALSLESCLTEVINQLKPLANNKGLQLSLELEDALPMVLADGVRLRQIVINMVSNALKFTEKGGVTIQAKMLIGYDMLRVSVVDTGIGISPAALDYIFEAFRQADGSTTRRFGGTGLGLTIARKLIELQGGEVAVESTLGRGSIFSFTLPTVP